MLCVECEGYNDNPFSRYPRQATRDFHSLRTLARARTRAQKETLRYSSLRLILITRTPVTYAISKVCVMPSRLPIDKLLNNVYNSDRNTCNEMKLYEIVTDPTSK